MRHSTISHCIGEGDGYMRHSIDIPLFLGGGDGYMRQSSTISNYIGGVGMDICVTAVHYLII